MPNLCGKANCTGCTACISVCPRGAIKMKPDEFGFLYPAVDAGICVCCGLCEQVCPVLNGQTIVSQPEAYAAYAKDTALRLQSSSGGVFSLLAREILRQGGAVYGAAYDEDFTVRHICAETESELEKLRGAKYAQSALDNAFQEIKRRLDLGQQVLFSGTPCQVAGLKSCLRKEYENLLCVDFVCHGVPSPKVWQEYVNFRARQDNEGRFPASINLREKSTGWSRYRYSNRFTYEKGKEFHELSGQNLYMKLFVGDYVNREACAECRFKGYPRVSDITLGDFWGIWDLEPEMDDDKGTSLVLLQSPKGKRMWQQIGGQTEVKAVTLEQTSRENPALLQACPAKENREQVMREVCAGNFAFVEALFLNPKAPSLIRRIGNKLRRMVRR